MWYRKVTGGNENEALKEGYNTHGSKTRVTVCSARLKRKELLSVKMQKMEQEKDPCTAFVGVSSGKQGKAG